MAGLGLTGALLAAGHWFPWWHPLDRLGAYIYGCWAILLGQGVYLKFDRRWLKLCAFVGLAGLVVGGAYWYDELAGDRAKRIAGASDGL